MNHLGAVPVFTDEVTAIGGEVADAIDASRRPRDLDLVDSFGVPHAEVQTRIGRGLITSAAVSDRDAALPSRANRHEGADPVAIRFGPLQLDDDASADSIGLIMKICDGTGLIDDDRVDPTVVVEIADG